MSEDDDAPWLAGYFREPRVWPITFVLLAHGVLGIAVALLDAVRRQGTLALIVLAAAAAATLYATVQSVRRRRVGLATPTWISLWILGAITAYAADRAGLY